MLALPDTSFANAKYHREREQQEATRADPNHRRLTAADAIELGINLKRFRDVHAGQSAKQLRRFGFLRLWHAENHRRKYGADHRWRHTQIVAEAHEAFRMAKDRGAGVGALAVKLEPVEEQGWRLP